MSSHQSQEIKGLPSNAYTPLKKGETYVPYVPADKSMHEITARSVIIGVVMAIVFSFAACYLGLVAGQVFEAAIPIAILAVGLASRFTRRSTILENVIIQSIGSASGVVVAGAIFTLPALYILGLKANLLHTFIACTLGGTLGVLFLIPLRRYFCVEEHGNLPFPEATATTEILTTGETGGKSAVVLVVSMIVGGVYDFLVEAMHVWPKALRTDVLLGRAGSALADKARWVFKLDATAALFGLGYIVGVKYASIIAAGSILSFLVFLPLIFHFGQHIPAVVPPGSIPIADMSELQIFSNYVQKIGIGAIAMAGFLGIAKMGKIIVSSFKVGLQEIGHGMQGSTTQVRTDTDMRIKWVIVLIAGTILAALAAFWIFASPAGSTGFAFKAAGIGILIVVLLSFLFTPVAARATAIVGVNPVSGMTLITLIISSLVLVSIGLTGNVGMTVALIMGCVVCTALSTSGAFVTDLKIGYWLGATPRNQQRWKFLGVVVSALSVSLAILLIHKAYGFTVGGGILEGGVPNPAIPAPQGNLMAVIIKSLMIESQIPYLLYGMGALIAILLEMIGISPLAFALGMYLPIQINMPLLVGGIVSHMVNKKSEKMQESPESSPKERGTLIASGFIAGGALMGVLGAILNLQIDWANIGKPIRFISVGVKFAMQTMAETGKTVWDIGEHLHYYDTIAGQLISFAAFLALCVFCYKYAIGKSRIKEQRPKTKE
ncbi:oligopeptide transporter, OPT family [bacterium]|nr:oligopeptide transporter, OPT family [bacterium]